MQPGVLQVLGADQHTSFITEQPYISHSCCRLLKPATKSAITTILDHCSQGDSTNMLLQVHHLNTSKGLILSHKAFKADVSEQLERTTYLSDHKTVTAVPSISCGLNKKKLFYDWFSLSTVKKLIWNLINGKKIVKIINSVVPAHLR